MFDDPSGPHRTAHVHTPAVTVTVHILARCAMVRRAYHLHPLAVCACVCVCVVFIVYLHVAALYIHVQGGFCICTSGHQLIVCVLCFCVVVQNV